jgi:hypothetical protein
VQAGIYTSPPFYDWLPPDRAISMAKEFPHAEVVGIDLIDVPTTSSTIPSNCTFLKEK